MRDVTYLIIITLFGAAIVAWAAMAFLSVQMLAHLRKRDRLAFFFNPLWWLPNQAKLHFTEEGMAYYRRTAKAGLCFLGLLVLAILGAILISYLEKTFST